VKPTGSCFPEFGRKQKMEQIFAADLFKDQVIVVCSSGFLLI
jgi:hypothetical protein